MDTKQTYFKSGRKAAAGFVSVLVGVLALFTGISGFAGAAAVEPEVIGPESGFGQDGNPTCVQLGYDYGIKIDAQPENGTYTSFDLETGTTGTFEIEIANAAVVDGIFEFDWTSTLPEGDPQAFDAVFVKQANGGNLYEYPAPVTSDTDLQSTGGGISHVSFCWSDEETTTTVGETTTTVEETTTTVEETTTTVEETTTTVEVEGTVVTPEDPEDTTEETVAGVQVGRELPRTGSSALLLTGLGTVLVGLGLVLLDSSRGGHRLGAG
ncbi:MAG: LPXTG cell wall anchor domain-containing protein [Acidimicrobiales bacterium]